MAKRFKVLGLHRESCYAKGKFCKKYEEGEIVAAVPRTLGIMTFKSFDEANDFVELRLRKHLQIVAVTPIGRGRTPREISIVSGDDPDTVMEYFYTGSPKNSKRCHPPEGTICYPAVLVLE